MDSGTVDARAIALGLVAGLALFLYGMEKLTENLNALAGPKMTRLLAAITQNRFKASLTGAAVTAVIQSSSITTVMCIGFISAGLMTLPQVVGIIIGANVGTTVTAQVIAFDVTRLAFPLISLGVALRLMFEKRALHRVGTLMLALGLIFFGMLMMSESTLPLRDYPPFMELMKSLRSPLLGLLAGAIFTAAVQSSSATTGLVIVLAAQGAMELEAGIAIILGANVGTCVTALLATLGRGRLALQTALVHVVFNLLGAILWLPLLDQLSAISQAIAPVGDLPRQIATAHTVFNLFNALLFLGFTTQLARFVVWLAPTLPVSQEPRVQPTFLDDVYLEVPALALDQVRLEIVRFGEWLEQAGQKVLKGVVARNIDAIERVAGELNEGLALHDAILAYMGKLHQSELEPALAISFQKDLVVANAFHTIAVVLSSEIIPQSRQLIENGNMDSDFLHGLEALGVEGLVCLKTSIEAFASGDLELAGNVLEQKGRIRELRDEALGSAVDRLKGEPLAVKQFRQCSNLVDEFRRVYYFASRVCHTLLKRSDWEQEQR